MYRIVLLIVSMLLVSTTLACTQETVKEVPVEKVVTQEVVREVPVEKIVEVEKEVVRTVEVEKPVVVEKEVVKEVQVPGQTVVVEKEVVRTVEVEKPVVVEKEVVRIVERIVTVIATPESGTVPESQRYGGTLRAVLPSSISSLDPVFFTGQVTNAVSRIHIYEQLFAWDDTIIVQPALVDKWTISPDGNTWTFDLRSGVKFHDGSPLVAEDAVASIGRMLPRGAPMKSLAQFLANDGVQAVDQLAFSVQTDSPFGVLLEGFAQPFGSPLVMPKDIATTPGTEDVGEENIIGTGAYMLAKWELGNRVILERYPDYESRLEAGSFMAGGRKAYLDRIDFLEVPSIETRVAGLKTGEWDVVDSIGLDFVPDLESHPDINIALYKPGNNSQLFFNHSQPPTDNKFFRQAILAAIDAEAVMAGMGPPGTWKICGSVFFCDAPYSNDASLDKYNNPNPILAKELLDKAGYNGEPFRLMHPTDVAAITPLGPVIKRQLEEVGINVEMPNRDWKTVISIIITPEGWNAFGNFGNYSSRGNPAFHAHIVGTKGFGYFESERMQDLHARFIAAHDQTEKQSLAREMQDVYYDELPDIVLGMFFQTTAHRNWLRNFPSEHRGFPVYNNAYVDR